MKKACVVLLFLLVGAGFAQNLQLHYDVSDDRQYLTSTLEMFKPDALGSTFWFVDFDYNSLEQNKTMSLAYFELARYFTLPVLENKLSATVQYNDGVLIGSVGDGNYFGAPLNSVWLGGLSYFIPVGKGNISVDVLYRHMDVSDSPDGQFTLVWFYPFMDGKLHFMGFLDYWTQDVSGEKRGVLLTEPQLWYMLNDHIGIGGEVELSRNFLYLDYEDEFKVFPTLGVKWNF